MPSLLTRRAIRRPAPAPVQPRLVAPVAALAPAPAPVPQIVSSPDDINHTLSGIPVQALLDVDAWPGRDRVTTPDGSPISPVRFVDHTGHPAGVAGVSGAIASDVTYTVGPSGADFSEPGAFTAWIAPRRILPGVTVTVQIASGTYVPTEQIIGHIDGAQIVWTNAGLNGAPLTGPDFAALDAIIQIDSVLGIDAASLAACRAAAEPIVRARYKVIFECSGAVDPVITCNGKHSGDWTNAPCLFITTACEVGATTGYTASGTGGGDGGVATFPGSCFFGFTTACLMTDYGGILNFENGLALFAGNTCTRTDFAGTLYANNIVLIGGETYGHRANHGGAAWIDAAYVHCNRSGIVFDNSPSMGRCHGSDIQYNYTGATVQFGASLKITTSSEFQGYTTSATGDGTTATVTFDNPITIPIGEYIAILSVVPSGYNGNFIVTASSPGSVSYTDTATGPQTVPGVLYLTIRPRIKNNARYQVLLTNGGDIDAGTIDMATTVLFANNGGAATVPPYGFDIVLAGDVDASGGTLTGHDKDIYITGSAVVGASGAVVGVAETSGYILFPDPNTGVYRVQTNDLPRSKSADFTVATTERWLINNKTSTCVVTLPSAAAFRGRVLFFHNWQPQLLVSATANVTPRGNGTAAIDILPAVDGAWCTLVSNGTTWVILQAG